MNSFDNKKNENLIAIKAGGWNFIGSVLLKGINYLTIPIFIRLMTIEEYGIYSTFLSYVTIISVIIGLGTTGIQQTAKYDIGENINSFNMLVIYLMLVLTCILGIVILGLYSVVSFDLPRRILILACVYSLFLSTINLLSCKLSVNFQYKTQLILSLFCSVGNIVLSLVLIYKKVFRSALDGRIYGIIIVNGLVFLIICVYLMIVTNHNIIIRNLKKYIKYIYSIGIPLLFHTLANSILSQFDRIILLEEKGAETAAIYSFAYTFQAIFLTIWVSIEPSLAAWLMKRLTNQKYQNIKNICSVLLGGIVSIGIMLVAIAPELIRVFGTQEYEDSITLIFPMITSVFFIAITNFYTQIEYFMRNTKLMSIGTIGASALNILLNLLLIPKYGCIAAAYTTLISYFFMSLFHSLISRKLFDLKIVYNENLLWAIVIIGSGICFIIQEFHDFLGVRIISMFIGIIIIVTICKKRLGKIKK